MSLEGYLQELNEQQIQEEFKIQLVKSPRVNLLCKIYRDIFKIVGDYDFDERDDCEQAECWDCYSICVDRVDKVKYSSKDIADFSIRLKEYEYRHNFETFSGLFLSALINKKGLRKEITLFTKHLSKPLYRLGFMNERNLTIIGDVGDFAGIDMTAGTMLIMGGAGDFLGRFAENGEIHVEGELKRISSDCRAKLYHKGEQVWPK